MLSLVLNKVEASTTVVMVAKKKMKASQCQSLMEAGLDSLKNGVADWSLKAILLVVYVRGLKIRVSGLNQQQVSKKIDELNDYID